MVVETIMARIRMAREGLTAITSAGTTTDTFRWPPNIDALSSSSQPLGLEGSDLWTLHLSTQGANGQLETAPRTGMAGTENSSSALSIVSVEPLTCAVKDNVIPPFTLGLPEYKILTLAKIACWNSHLSVIRRIAESSGTNYTTREQDVSVIFEDDIDMEWDIRERLAKIWTLLPSEWDIIFLGV
jgi:hypothetical protein